MKTYRPGFKPVYTDEPEPAPAVPAVPTQAEQIAMAKASADQRHAASLLLEQDGPTLQEYVAAGYDPATYPPEGYAAVEAAPKVDPYAKATTELIPPVKPKPLIDNNAAPGDPTPLAQPPSPPPPPSEPEPPHVDPLLK